MIKIDISNLVDSRFLEIPYILGGKEFAGCDCIGLAILWLKEFGVEYRYDDGHGPVLEHWWEKNPHRFLNAISELGRVIQFSDVKKFDCLLFFGEESWNRFPTCLGIMVDDRHFLTTVEKIGSFVQMLNLEWKQKFWGAIRLGKVVEKGLSSWDL